MQARRDQRRGRHAGAAGQRFAFHPALERPHPDMVRTQPLHEIHVGPFWREVRMAADFRAELLHHGAVGVGHEQHRMRHPRIERMNRLGAGGERHLLIEPQILGRVRLTVTRSPWKLAVMTPATVSNVKPPLSPVSFCTKRAKQRAPLPHISPVLPSLL
jgi:hypothetical protein